MKVTKLTLLVVMAAEPAAGAGANKRPPDLIPDEKYCSIIFNYAYQG
jgi:hypothetical protein